MGDGRDLIRLFGLGVVFEFKVIVVLGQPAVFAISFLAHVWSPGNTKHNETKFLTNHWQDARRDAPQI